MSKQDQNSELRNTAESWAKLLRLNDREAWKIVSNFSIAGAVLVTAVTIAGKDLSPVVNNTTESGTPSTINVRVVDMPELSHGEVEVDLKKGPKSGLMVKGWENFPTDFSAQPIKMELER